MNCYFEFRLNTKQIPSSEHSDEGTVFLKGTFEPPSLQLIEKQDERIDRSNGSSCTSRNYYR